MAAPGLTARGTAGNAGGGTTITITPTGNLAASSIAYILISLDNSTTGGGQQGSLTVTDTKGNTWTRRISDIVTGGAANAGVEAASFDTTQNGGALTTGDTITVSWTTAATAKTVMLLEITGTPQYSASSSSAASATSSPTITTSTLATDTLIIGSLHIEQGSNTVVTDDGDSSNGSWSAGARQTQGTTSTSSSSTFYQYKQTTGSGTQTFNPTTSTTSDQVIAWVAYTTSGGGGVSVKTLAALGVG